MVKDTYHPNAYLHRIRNVPLGLVARSKILIFLEAHKAGISYDIRKETDMHYKVAMHHLRLLEKEGLVKSTGGKPIVWELTGSGQKRLMEKD